VKSTVRIEIAGMGTRKIRIADLHTEITDQAISRVLTSYGEVLDIRHEMWSRTNKKRQAEKILSYELMIRNRDTSIRQLKQKLEGVKQDSKKLKQQLNVVERYLFVKICHMFS
jgi:cell shape-determining protein MreC